MNQELPDVQAGKGREIRDQIANIHWIIKKELKSLLMKVKEESENDVLTLNIQK